MNDRIFDHEDEDGDRVMIGGGTGDLVLLTAEDSDSGADVAVWIDPRVLRDALSKHLGEAGEPVDEEPLADWERELLGIGPALDRAALLQWTAERIRHDRSSADAARLWKRLEREITLGRFDAPEAPAPEPVVSVPATVSAVEVEIFREAWESALPGNRIRSGLLALDTYRAWKAQTKEQA